jgi:NAD(P)H dehydrogenase (quinone)
MPEENNHVLLVVAHPDRDSLTHHLCHELEAVLTRWATVETADLHRERFDPRWSPDDRRSYQDLGDVPEDVAAEQRRLDQATDLVLLFPVYWWSMPALAKGWVDRVFINGWAFDYDAAEGLRPKLQELTVHVVPVAASDAGLYERHGYEEAMRTQIEHGLVDFCGGVRGTMTFVYDSEDADEQIRTLRVRTAVEKLSAHFADREAIHTAADRS